MRRLISSIAVYIAVVVLIVFYLSADFIKWCWNKKPSLDKRYIDRAIALFWLAGGIWAFAWFVKIVEIGSKS